MCTRRTRETTRMPMSPFDPAPGSVREAAADDGLPAGRRSARWLVDWCARYNEQAVIGALRAWCAREIDARIRGLGDGSGFRVAVWQGLVLGWFWSAANPAGHRICVASSAAFSHRSLDAFRQLDSETPLRQRIALVAELLAQAEYSSGVLPSAEQAADLLVYGLVRTSGDIWIGPVALAGIIVLSQDVARQVAAIARSGQR